MEEWIFNTYKSFCFQITDNIVFKQNKKVTYNKNEKKEYSDLILLSFFKLKETEIIAECQYCGAPLNNAFLHLNTISKKGLHFCPHNYLVYRKIEKDFPLIDDCYVDASAPIENKYIYEEYLKRYFDELKRFLELDEIKKILNTDYWIEVPIDWGPYK